VRLDKTDFKKCQLFWIQLWWTVQPHSCYRESVKGRSSICGRMIAMWGMQCVHCTLMLSVFLVLTNHLKLRRNRAIKKKTPQSKGHRIRAIQKICASYWLIRFCWLPWKRDHMTLHNSEHQIHLHWGTTLFSTKEYSLDLINNYSNLSCFKYPMRFPIIINMVPPPQANH